MITPGLSPHTRNLASALAGAAVLFLGTARIATQSRIIPSPPPANKNVNSKRSKVTTLRASDSPEGSRVAVTADQSLNEYEAYRRGDRFYVKIPPADVSRADTVRGRAFSDVKVQRDSGGTIVSFHLQPGATARVEAHGNKLDVVFTMPGAKSSASRDIARNDAGPAPSVPNWKRQPTRNANSSVAPNTLSPSTSRNANERGLLPTTKPTPTPKPSPTPKTSPSPSPTSSASAQTSSTAKSSIAIVQHPATVSPSASGSPAPEVAQTNTWNDIKQRARYWILLAQLNPIPIAIGAAVLLFLIGLLILQRRRARATRRERLRKALNRVQPIRAEATRAVAATAAVKPAMVAATAGAVAAKETVASLDSPDEPVPGSRQPERDEPVSDELKKLMAGGDYDESVVGSDDRKTRQLVGAELLSALVGRNLQRRERARAAFMKHGYFDDATRDLRVADSANERAAAARRLSFVHDREATPHLIAALDDSSPDVRRAAVEALMDLRDPAAITSLNSLMQNETDRRVPRSLIKHAIESCATGHADELSLSPVSAPPSVVPPPVPSAVEIEREVIEI